MGRGAAFGDFDNDGDMDVLIMNVNEPPSLLRNDAPPGNHWIKIRLEGTKSNRSAIGSRVLARYGGKVQVQEVLSGSSFISANDPRLHFGLGLATAADIEIHWPLGLVEKYPGLPPAVGHHPRRPRHREGPSLPLEPGAVARPLLILLVAPVQRGFVVAGAGGAVAG